MTLSARSHLLSLRTAINTKETKLLGKLIGEIIHRLSSFCVKLTILILKMFLVWPLPHDILSQAFAHLLALLDSPFVPEYRERIVTEFNFSSN